MPRYKRVSEIDYQVNYAIFSTACSIVYKYLHDNQEQGRTQDLSEGVARFFRNKKIDN